MSKTSRRRRKKRNLLIYASSETDASILYGTHFQGPDPFTFIRTANGRRHLVMSDLEFDRAKAQSNAHKVHSLSHYMRLAKKKIGRDPGIAEVLATILKDFGIRGVWVPESFPLGIAEGLRERNIRVSVHRGPVFPERLHKTPKEIAEIKKAFRATEKGLQAAVDTLRKSKIKSGYLIHKGRRLTAETLRTIINTTILGLGFIPKGTIVAPGKKGCDPHEQGSGLVRANEPIIIDIFPRSEESGYFADITRTVVRGKASDTVRKMHRTVFDGQRLGLKMIKHGVNGRKVHQAINRLFEGRGFETGMKDGRMQGFFHSTGHGLGLEIHEPPRIGPVSATLEKGMVVTVEPGLYYYPYGGVRIEDTILVTKTGIECLSRFPKTLEI